MREWNADAYHRVSDPQVGWGLPVLARLPLRGDELVLDVGCGTGRPTEKLFERLPRGRAVAIDRSSNMVRAAREYAARLRATGFADVQTSVEAAPVVQPDADVYRHFVANVVCHPHLARLPEPSLRDRFMDALTEQAARDKPAFELDYWRLNLDAAKPPPGG